MREISEYSSACSSVKVNPGERLLLNLSLRLHAMDVTVTMSFGKHLCETVQVMSVLGRGT